MSGFESRRSGIWLFLLLLVLIFFPIFLHLGYMPFRVWDESILGVNALEMERNHNYIVTYFYGFPDFYRCKPPLMLWFIILSTKLLGFSEFSLRLPSALAAAMLCIYLFFMLKKITGNYLIGFFAVLILVSCQGYIGLHITRSGEYDSFWILFSTIFSFSLFIAVEAEEKAQQSKYLLLFFVFLTLGVLTKGLAVMLQQAPGLLVYVLWRKKFIPFLKNKMLYAGLSIFLVFGIGYYFLRESMNPGYLRAVYLHEIRIQFAGVGHDYDLGIDGPIVRRFPFLYYVRRMFMYQFTSYIFIFPVALYASLKLTDPPLRKLVSFSCLIGFIFFCVISLCTKRVPHFDAPLFIYLSLIVAAFFYVLYNFVQNSLTSYVKATSAPLVAFLCVLVLLAKPYYDILKTVYHPTDIWEGEFSRTALFFQRAAQDKQEIRPYKLVLTEAPGYGPATALTCYQKELAEHNINLWFARPEQLAVNDTVVVFNNNDEQAITRIFHADTLRHLDYCNADILLIRGEGIKQNASL